MCVCVCVCVCLCVCQAVCARFGAACVRMVRQRVILLDKSANCLTRVVLDAMYTQRVELPNPVFVFVSSRRKLPCVTAMKHERVTTETYENIH